MQYGNALELSNAVIANGKDTIRTNDQALSSLILTEIIMENNGYHGRSYGYTNLDSGDIWFRLYRNYTIGAANIATRTYLGSWPLTRWQYQPISELMRQQYLNIDLRDYPLPVAQEYVASGAGCLGNSPLTYGDIENDGVNELVIYLNGYMTIFSPSYGRTVFSLNIKEIDQVTSEQRVAYEGAVIHPEAQYLSTLAYDNGYPITPSVRVYAKIFEGDFDKDGNPDILVWEKGYRSNSGDDPQIGFTLEETEKFHFERDLSAQAEGPAGITGEYLPQDPPAADIQKWLAENNLTWSKGYPSKSECPGEEGQLIPEMHDPLLNDPEVLQ
jgi:hypothetical protein